ncbi:MAG: hypothetical protein IAF94_17450 [Pirellulaceae bacterium]|nr:hypothetical protein [Pirellulaceae bacterium]
MTDQIIIVLAIRNKVFSPIARCLVLSCLFASTALHGDERAISVSVILSDSAILARDSLTYKLVIQNRTVSTVHLRNVKGQPKAAIIQFLECRAAGKDWACVREVSASKEGRFQGDLQVEGKGEFAFHGQLFLNESRDFFFSEPGDYDFRIRLSCLLGEFVTEPQTISVKKRPSSEVASVMNSRRLLERFLSPLVQSTSLEEKVRIQKALAPGAIKKSLDLRVMTLLYKTTGRVGDKEMDILPAYKEIVGTLDEVRRDVATCDFLWIAYERKAWAELVKLLGEVRKDSNIRRSFIHELENAIEMGLYQPGKP